MARKKPHKVGFIGAGGIAQGAHFPGWQALDNCQIAAIAESNGMIVATRDVRPFRGIGLRVVNPWESGA